MKVVFVASMLWEYGLGYALMPFAYLVLGKAIQEKFAPMDWNLFVKSETHKAKFRTSWTRVVTHSEAISALGGGQTERELLNRRFEGFTSMTATINRALVPFDACQRFMYMHGMGVIFFAFCVGPATFRPPSQATGAERIAENTELYGRVGYQFKMFEMLMITAWSMVNIWEQYKKLTGNGVRFNELLDTLDEIDAMDSANTNDRIVDGKIIEFKNVNVSVAALLSAPRSKQDAAAQIFTPTETKLVHDISFQVGERDSMLLTGHNGAGKSSVTPTAFRSVPSVQQPEIGDARAGISLPGRSVEHRHRLHHQARRRQGARRQGLLPAPKALPGTGHSLRPDLVPRSARPGAPHGRDGGRDPRRGRAW